MRTGFVERYGKLTELDREFDLKFWQDQPAQARFDAAWELIVHAHRVKRQVCQTSLVAIDSPKTKMSDAR